MILSEQIRPWDTLACCWDVKQSTNETISWDDGFWSCFWSDDINKWPVLGWVYVSVGVGFGQCWGRFWPVFRVFCMGRCVAKQVSVTSTNDLEDLSCCVLLAAQSGWLGAQRFLFCLEMHPGETFTIVCCCLGFFCRSFNWWRHFDELFYKRRKWVPALPCVNSLEKIQIWPGWRF